MSFFNDKYYMKYLKENRGGVFNVTVIFCLFVGKMKNYSYRSEFEATYHSSEEPRLFPERWKVGWSTLKFL